MEEPPKEFKMKMADWIQKFNAPGTYEGYLPISRLAWEWMQVHHARTRDRATNEGGEA